jgi:hypothetical protein
MAMQRVRETPPEFPAGLIEKVQSAAGDLLWPNGEKQQEPRFIQISLSRYNQFLELLDQLEQEARSIEQEQTRARGTRKTGDAAWPKTLRYLRQHLLEPVEFVTNWLTEAHQIAHHVERWSGNLLRHAWRPDHPRFQRDLLKVLHDWDLDEDRYWLEKLLERTSANIR